MPTKTLEEFIQGRLRAYDSTIDLSSGSPADAQIVQPIVARYAPDPLDMPVEDFIDARLAQEFPDTNAQEGTGIKDLLVKPTQVLLDPVVRELRLVQKGQSFLTPDQLADSEVDALAANLFVSRNTGDLARGIARLYFNAPQAVRVSAGNVFYTADNLRFFPTRQQSISAESMVFNQSGSLYYFDVDVVAEQAGDVYNIDPDVNPIVGVTNISVAVRVINLTAFSGGLATESSADLIARAENSTTERSLVTPRGVHARLPAEFPAVTQIQVIGFGDAEMKRDLLTGGDLGAPLLSGNDGRSADDGSGGATTTHFKVRTGSLLPPGFAVGEVGSPLYLLTSEVRCGHNASISNDHLDRLLLSGQDIFNTTDVGRTIWIVGALNGVQVLEIADVGGGYLSLVKPGQATPYSGSAEESIAWTFTRPPQQNQIASFLSQTELVLMDGQTIASDVNLFGSFIWEIRRQELSISGVPTGVVLASEREALTTQSNQVHLGGCSDFYVRGASADQESKVFSSIEDEHPIFRGTAGRTLSTSPSFFWDRPQPDVPDDSYGTGAPTSVNFVGLVEPGDSLVVESGPDAGTKTILRVGRSNNSAIGSRDYGCLQVTPPFTSTQTFLRYKIVKTVTVDLRQPTLFKASGTDGVVTQTSSIFTTASSVNFLERSVVAGDRLRVLTGEDAGEYTISRVSGAGSRNLELAAAFTSTAEALSWEIVRVQEGLKFPLLQIRSIDLLDSSGQSTGHQIPYGVPVDARSSAFSNFGKGGKCVTTQATVGIVGRTSLEASDITYPLPDTYIGLVVNGTEYKAITLTGAVNKNEVVSRINEALPAAMAKLVPDSLGKDRLWIQSDTNWIQVLTCYPSAGAQWLGLVGADESGPGDDNRQIYCEDPNFSWTDPTTWTETAEGDRRPLDVGLDSVQIQGVGTSSNLYLKRVSANRIFVLGFDEKAKIVRFPTPQVGATVRIGTRSLGTVRVYFKDPTSMEVLGNYRPALQNTATHPANLAAVRDGASESGEINEDEPHNTYFEATVNGTKLRFIPDPALSRVLVPDPASAVPNNLCCVADTYSGYALASDRTVADDLDSRSADVDFLARRVRAGDSIEITFAPILGTADFTLASLPGKSFDIKLDGGTAKTVTFTDQVTDAKSMLALINDTLGSTIAYTYENGEGDTRLRLEADFSLEILTRSVDSPSFATWAIPYMGMYFSPRNNKATNAGTYKIKAVGKTFGLDVTNALLLEDPDALTTTWNSQHFVVRRERSQRLHATAMRDQMENGLYYMDVQLLSEGFGDGYNIPEDTVLTLSGYSADGYHFEVENENLSFSTEEQVSLVFSRQVLLEGETDDLSSAISLVGQNLQINYDYSSLTESVQLFAGSDQDRVVVASLLVRHLLPAYLYFELVYQGGSSEEVVQADVDKYIAGLGPSESVQASKIQGLATKRGAAFVQNPLTMVALGTDAGRVLSVVRSSNTVSHGRLSTFFPGKVVVSRS